MATKGKKKQQETVVREADMHGNMQFASPLDMQFHDIEKAPESAKQAQVAPVESGVTEAEYQEPVDPVEREYPGLHQDMPKILKAILRELIIARVGK